MSDPLSNHDNEPVVPAAEAAAAMPPAGVPMSPAEPGAAVSEPEPESDDDDGPVELADPFEGDENAKPIEETVDEDASAPVGTMDWFILKVQSNREDSVREALLRRISIQGMDKMFGEVIVPKEQVNRQQVYNNQRSNNFNINVHTNASTQSIYQSYQSAKLAIQ
jgi:transcriptional antiterminator NusG